MRPTPTRAAAAAFPFIALAMLASASCSNPEGPSGPNVAYIAVVTGGGQTGVAGSALPVAVRVKALGPDSSPLAGVMVHFVVTAGGGSVTPDSAATDPVGIATTVWTLGASGTQTITAHAGSNTSVVAQINASCLAITGLAVVSGNSQTGYASSGLPLAALVKVTDQNGHGMAGVMVHFTITGGGGVLLPDSMASDTAGYGYAFWMLGSAVGTQGLRASVSRPGTSALTADFTATAQATTRPAGTLQTPLSVASRPFGLAVSGADAVYVTQLDAAAVTRSSAQSMAFVKAFGVGNVPTAVAFDSAGTRAWVANQSDNSVSVVDAAADSVIAVKVLGGATFNIAVAPGGARVYVSTNAGRIYELDTGTNAVVDSIIPPGAGAMSAMVFGSGGTRLYAADVNLGVVYEIDPSTKQVLRTFNVNGIPQGMAIAPDGAFLYIANAGAGFVNRVDLASGSAAGAVQLPATPFGLALTKDGTQIYVGAFGGHVYVVDRSFGTIVRTITTGGTPRRIGFSHDGLTAVVANEAGWVDFIK